MIPDILSRVFHFGFKVLQLLLILIWWYSLCAFFFKNNIGFKWFLSGSKFVFVTLLGSQWNTWLCLIKLLVSDLYLILFPVSKEVDWPILSPLDDRPPSLSLTLFTPGLQESVGTLRPEQIDPTGSFTWFQHMLTVPPWPWVKGKYKQGD